MNSKTYELLKAKLKKLNLAGRRKEGILLLRARLKNNNIYDYPDLFLNLAFFLYHNALSDYGNTVASAKTKNEARNQINEAVELCKKIISLKMKKTVANVKIQANARVYMAQIYAITGNPLAITLANENFNEIPNATMANRLADVYMRLGKKEQAARWYKKYEKMALKEGVPRGYVAADMAIHYKHVGKGRLAEKYLKAALENLGDSLEEKSRLKILGQYFNIEHGQK